MPVEVRDVSLEHYSASAVLVRFKSGDKIWLPLSQINQVPSDWSLPDSLSSRRGKVLVITDWIAKQKGFKVVPRELDIDPERAEAPAAPAKSEALVGGKSTSVTALEQQCVQLRAELSLCKRELRTTQEQLAEAKQVRQTVELRLAEARALPREAQAQRDKALADLALAQDALRKATERADKAEAYIAAQGRSHRPEANKERFMLLELE